MSMPVPAKRFLAMALNKAALIVVIEGRHCLGCRVDHGMDSGSGQKPFGLVCPRDRDPIAG